MPVGHWGSGGNDDEWETSWDAPCTVSRNVSPEAFMEELTANAGGYNRFFRMLVFHYLGWWAAVLIVPTVFLDHHKCEAQLSFLAWLIYAATVFAMLSMAVLLELSVVQQLGLLKAGELSDLFSEKRWQVPLASTVLWKLDTYTDIAFIFIARDCGSSLWWASFATFIFGIVFGQLLLNTCFACTDCDHELPASFGFVLLDFKLVNKAVRDILPFDPDASDLPVARPVTLRTTGHLVGMEKVVGDVAQVCIQIAFLHNTRAPQTFVIFSIFIGMVHGVLALVTVMRECVKDEWDLQSRGVQLGTALMPDVMLSHGSFSTTLQPLDSRASAGKTPPSAREMEAPGSKAMRSNSPQSPLEHSSSRTGQMIGKSMQEIPDLL